MSFNTFGKLFRFSTWGESHGPAIGCIVDGCPPNINLKEQDIQAEDGIRDRVASRGLGDVYKRQANSRTMRFTPSRETK